MLIMHAAPSVFVLYKRALCQIIGNNCISHGLQLEGMKGLILPDGGWRPHYAAQLRAQLPEAVQVSAYHAGSPRDMRRPLRQHHPFS